MTITTQRTTANSPAQAAKNRSKTVVSLSLLPSRLQRTNGVPQPPALPTPTHMPPEISVRDEQSNRLPREKRLMRREAVDGRYRQARECSSTCEAPSGVYPIHEASTAKRSIQAREAKGR